MFSIRGEISRIAYYPEALQSIGRSTNEMRIQDEARREKGVEKVIR
jgi:hypothetical protein